MRQLTRVYKNASEYERGAVNELRKILKKKLMTLRRAENHRKRRKERARKRNAFIQNPFHATKKLLGEKKNGQLVCSKEEAEAWLESSYRDEAKDTELGECKRLTKFDPPSVEFDLRNFKFKEVQDVIRKARSASAPGPSGIPL